MAVLKQLSLRGTIWPDSCANAVEHLVAALDQRNNDHKSAALPRVRSDGPPEPNTPSRESRDERTRHVPSDSGYINHSQRPGEATRLIENVPVPSFEQHYRR